MCSSDLSSCRGRVDCRNKWQGLQIVVDTGDSESLRGVEAVAVAQIAAGDLLDRKRHDLAAVERQKPLDGAGKGQGGAGPAHGFWEHGFANQRLQQARQECFRRLTPDVFGLRDVEDPVVLARFYDNNQADKLISLDRKSVV